MDTRTCRGVSLINSRPPLQVFEWLVFSDPKVDAHRFADAVRAAVAEGKARDYKRFRTWAASVDARPRPKHPLAPRGSGVRKGRKKGGGEAGAGDEQALIAQIRRGSADGLKHVPWTPRKPATAKQGLLHQLRWLAGQIRRHSSYALSACSNSVLMLCWLGTCGRSSCDRSNASGFAAVCTIAC